MTNSSKMWTNKILILSLIWIFTLSNSQYKGVRRVYGIHPGERLGTEFSGHQQYRSSEGHKSARVQNWLHSYKDLLDEWVAPSQESEVVEPKTNDLQPKHIDHRIGKYDAEDFDYKKSLWDKTTTQATEIPKPTESFLMSFLGDLIPYFQSSEKIDSGEDIKESDIGEQDTMTDYVESNLYGQQTISDSDQTDRKSDRAGLASNKEIYQDSPLYENPFDLNEYDEPQELEEMSRIKRLGLAEYTGYDNTIGRRVPARPRKKLAKKRKLRRRSTTERYSEEGQNSPSYDNSPDFKSFCRQVIRTIAENVQELNFQKVTMYQEIWYLISKYNIPVKDHDVDIVILIDDLCKDDENLTKEIGMDNSIEVDEKDDASPSFKKKDFPFLDNFGQKSEYSSVAKFPQFHQEPQKNHHTSQKRLTTVKPHPHVSYVGEKFPPGFIQQDYLFYPTQIQPEKKQNSQINHENNSPTENPIKVAYPQVTSYTPRQQETERFRPQLDAPVQPAQLPFIKHKEDTKNMDDIDVITLYPEIDIDNLKEQGYQFVDNEPQDILVASSLSFGDNAQNIVLTKGKVKNVQNHRPIDQLTRNAQSINRNVKQESFDKTQIRRFTPSELVSSTFSPPIRMSPSTMDPPLRRGTVENIARPRATFPPVVKTSKLDLENEIHPNYLDSLPKIPPSPDAITDKAFGLSTSTIYPTTFKTSKMEIDNQYVKQNNIQETYSSLLQNKLNKLLENEAQYEEPSRSSEEIPDKFYKQISFSPQYASVPGYFPQQREPYPYKNFPLPYMTPPKPIHFSPKKPVQRGQPKMSSRTTYDREDLMTNKMDNMKNIDGFIDTLALPRIDQQTEYPINVYRPYFNKPKPKSKLENRERVANNIVPPQIKPSTKPPVLKALTLHQLSMGLSTEKQVTPTVPGRVIRKYTVFDMADAVTVRLSTPVANDNDLKPRNPVINNRQTQQTENKHVQEKRPPFIPYSNDFNNEFSTPRTFFSNSEIIPKMYRPEQDYNTLRPDNIEYDQSPEPSRNHDDKLMVDFNTDRPKRNVSIDDLLFLYNITFLTDHEAITPSIGNRRQEDHNIDISMFPDSIFKAKQMKKEQNKGIQDYEDELPEYGISSKITKDPNDLFDYSSLPLDLPDYEALNSEDKFSDALEEFLKEYDSFSKPSEDLKSEEEAPLEKIMSEIVGGSPDIAILPKDVFNYEYEYDYENMYDEEMYDEEKENETDTLPWPGHHVNHRTHSVPEFAHQLISQQREGSGQKDIITTIPLPIPGMNHKLPGQRVPTTETTTQSKIDANANLYKNHKPYFTSPEILNYNEEKKPKDGIKEVLMVLNGTGKTSPKNRTNVVEINTSEKAETRKGYYPEQKSEYEDYDFGTEYEIDKPEESQINSSKKNLTMDLDIMSQLSDANNERNNIQTNDVEQSNSFDNIQNNEEEDLTKSEVEKENKEKAFFYPVVDIEEESELEATTESLIDIYENLSNMIDSWDTNSEEIKTNDEFIEAIEKEKLDNLLLEDYNANSLYEDSTDDFPMKSFMTEAAPGMIRNEANVSKVDEAGLNPEKLAYILIGVCCGLSILCLIVVAVSIGYKSETHYRLEEPRRKHIRLLKANNSDEDASSNTSDQDDKSRAKLGNWFTGKHTIQTMERKSNLVFPTSVYLENLASSATHSDLSRSDSSRSVSPSVASENNDNLFEVEAQNCDSGDYNDGSISSMNSVKTDPNLVHHDTDSIEPDLDDANKVKKAYKSGIGGKNKSSYAVSSSKFSKGEQNLSQVGLSEGQERFRFISQTPTGRRNSNTTMGSNHENIKDSSEITWSQNSDRLI